MLTLTLAEIEYAISLAESFSRNADTLLLKLRACFTNERATTNAIGDKLVEVEISGDEAEILLDALPVPEKNQAVAVAQLRTKLGNFLNPPS